MTSNKEDFIDKFFTFEKNEGVFSIKINGIHIWEWIRIGVFREIQKKRGMINETHSRGVNRFQQYGGAIKNLFLKNPYLSSQHDIVFVGGSRRKQRGGKYWWDIYCDTITTNSDLDYIHFERPSAVSGHKKPAKTGNIRYTDIIDYIKDIPKLFGLLKIDLSDHEKKIIGSMNNRINSFFDVDIDLRERIKKTLIDRKGKKRLYKILFRKVKPEIVLLVGKSGNKVKIEVCKELGIPVVELQHGGCHHNDTKYVHPENAKPQTYADYLFLWGEFWKDTVNYPLEDENIHVVGFPYLEEEVEKYSNNSTKNQVVFISQGNIGKKMSKFAVEFQRQNKSLNVVYKLHPGEYPDWNEKYPWLEKEPVTVVDKDNPPLYQILSESKALIGSHSSVIYEALNFDTEIYLLKSTNIKQMEELIKRTNIQTASNVTELTELVNSADRISDSKIEKNYFFENKSVENINNSINSIIDKEY